MSLIKKHLQYSPLCVSVTAWSEKNGVYVDNGQRNTHWVMLYGWNKSGWLVFDSYAPHKKTLSFDHNMEVCKRYQLVASTRKQQISIMQQLLNVLWSLLGLLKEETPIPPPISPPSPEIAKPKPSLLIPWAKAIEMVENSNKNWNNPGAIRNLTGGFMKFPTYQKGFDYLCDYLTRAATGKHKAYPKGGESTLLEFQRIYAPSSDGNSPETYAKVVADKLGILITTKIKNLV